MTDSRPQLQQSLLEQLADLLPDQTLQPDDAAHLRQLLAKVMAESRCWDDDLHTLLRRSLGQAEGSRAARMFGSGFSPAYRARFSASEAVHDIRMLQSISVSSDVSMQFNPCGERPGQALNFKLYSQGEPVILSDVVPMLENLGMRVLDEHPYRVMREDGQPFGISDFTVELQTAPRGTELALVKPLLQVAFRETWNGFAENDAFNRLILACGLGWRDVAMLRAYARYIKQLRFGFSQPFIADALARHADITNQLVALFRARFEPDLPSPDRRAAEAERLEQELQSSLENVDSLDDDRILRRFFVLIKATLRTNFFQRQGGEPKPYLSLKLNPRAIPDIPQPRPMFEVFVYSPRVEGVHLRAGRVARGGLRWSDRVEDYRTEILGLVKAQQVKNSVIVPEGAKGGFIVKQPPEGGWESLREEGIACYQLFIRGLLDLTDNLDGGRVVPPPRVVRYDDDDTYLVVAADKGTATFSDIANRLAQAYGFWLGDAFASGGSEGYDHKKMGITARGAWESVKRHFLERGLNTQSDAFTVVGIGDMSGDVFGNGMLLSETIRLVGAFNHQHIFIDPQPDAARAFVERERLFSAPGSSWADYDRTAISAGGGVFSRSSKSIAISPQMAKALAIEAAQLTPNELISALLRAPVSLVWNGGIGTYVKSAAETHEQVGDKANDGVRVDSHELRCQVLGEGGNLGFTQLARIGFSREGGAVNSDFIDNAGGVDCSDHEVNIKILLNDQVHQGLLTLEQRNRRLREMTAEVSELVLRNNYRQALALTIAEAAAAAGVDPYQRLMRRLESEGRLDRSLEFLPSDEALQERRERGAGLTRPELSVLISYAKIELKQSLLGTAIVHDERFRAALHSAFPESLLAAYPAAVNDHPLKAEITATQMANELVNRMGITWLDEMQRATQASCEEIAGAYWIASRIYGIESQWRAIEALDGEIAADVQLDLFRDLIRLVTRATNWLLRNRQGGLDPVLCQQRYGSALNQVLESVESLRAVVPASRWLERYDQYRESGVPDRLAACCASAGSRYWLLDVIEVALRLEQGLDSVAWVYFSLGESLDLTWLDQQMRVFPAQGHWQKLATAHYRDELDRQLRHLTSSVFRSGADAQAESVTPEQLLEVWRTDKKSQLGRWQRMLADMQAANEVDCAIFSVAHGVLRELASTAG
ncbi:NAD-glutamate dehydrogenase [Marinobacter sp. SS21]|uniref:NAD-glutamate dehydrogenase n=1 Tax=Marinobacter sp. SS21 TaxID=2979460 RepID=UPI00232AC4B5|nr:NAD-glutamate dehydrogenase domain-containing protein [Marinobacter sp. SS21]MDC0661479.1 NAD-glutamate dehydrogenase [Marinobacter sp. SS21]